MFGFLITYLSFVSVSLIFDHLCLAPPRLMVHSLHRSQQLGHLIAAGVLTELTKVSVRFHHCLTKHSAAVWQESFHRVSSSLWNNVAKKQQPDRERERERESVCALKTSSSSPPDSPAGLTKLTLQSVGCRSPEVTIVSTEINKSIWKMGRAKTFLRFHFKIMLCFYEKMKHAFRKRLVSCDIWCMRIGAT